MHIWNYLFLKGFVLCGPLMYSIQISWKPIQLWCEKAHRSYNGMALHDKIQIFRGKCHGNTLSEAMVNIPVSNYTYNFVLSSFYSLFSLFHGLWSVDPWEYYFKLRNFTLYQNCLIAGGAWWKVKGSPRRLGFTLQGNGFKYQIPWLSIQWILRYFTLEVLAQHTNGPKGQQT